MAVLLWQKGRLLWGSSSPLLDGLCKKQQHVAGLPSPSLLSKVNLPRKVAWRRASTQQVVGQCPPRTATLRCVATWETMQKSSWWSSISRSHTPTTTTTSRSQVSLYMVTFSTCLLKINDCLVWLFHCKNFRKFRRFFSQAFLENSKTTYIHIYMKVHRKVYSFFMMSIHWLSFSISCPEIVSLWCDFCFDKGP